MAESEVVLLRRFAENGDSAAFSRIVQMHAGLVYGACLRVLDDKERAADAVQETFFQLVKHAGEVTGSVPAWLHRVATRKAIDVVRRDSARRRREAKYAVKRLAETEKWEDISLFVDEAMDELDEETKDVLVRHFFEGKAMSEVGAEVGVSQATVSRRVEAGVAMLRDKLHKRGILVAAAVLGGLLGQNAVQAAPAAVMAELGKMAMVGGAVAGAGAGSAAGTGAAGTAAGSAAGGGAGAGTATSAVGAGVMAGVKAKVITAAAVAVVGVGSVVTYNAVKTEPASRPTATSPARQSAPASRVTRSRPAPRAAAVSRPVEQPEVQEAQAEPADTSVEAATANDEQPVGGYTTRTAAPTTGAAVAPQGGGGGYGMGGYGGGYGGAVMGGRATRATDSNSTTSRRVSRRAYRDSEGNVHVVEVETEEQQAQDPND